MLKVWWWLQGRLFQLWHYVRDQTEQIEKIGPPYTFLFLYFSFFLFFLLFFLALSCDDMGHFLIFFCIFMFTNIGLPDIERRKRKRNLLLGQPQGSLSERIDTPCAYVDLQLTFSCGLPIWRLIPDQFEWCIAAAGTCAIVVCVIVNVVLYPAVM